MKKLTFCALCFLLFVIAACGKPSGTVVVVTQTPSDISSEPAVTLTPSEALSESPAPATTATSSSSPLPTQTPKMYTSFAHMVSFNVSAGTADFDYFDMLRGNDAVKWLVEQEGYTQADAQALVVDYADSEFIEKNTNAQLRTVDLNTVPVTLIINNDGTLTDELAPRTVSIDDLQEIFNDNPNLLLKTFFYKVHVSDSGTVKSVEQVYWP